MTPLDDLIDGAHAVLIGGSTAMRWMPPADVCPADCRTQHDDHWYRHPQWEPALRTTKEQPWT